jgi:hypothetical protein
MFQQSLAKLRFAQKLINPFIEHGGPGRQEKSVRVRGWGKSLWGSLELTLKKDFS